MKRVAYGGESFITSDAAAGALLEFAAAAAMNEVAEVVMVPSLRDDGQVVVMNLLIGPSSELITYPIDSSFEEPDTLDAVALLRERAGAFGASKHMTYGGPVRDLGFEPDDLEPQ